MIVTIKVYQPDGTLYDQQHLQTNPVNRVIGPLGLLSEDLETMFGFSGKQTLDGWLEVEASARDVFGTLSYSIPAIGSVASVAGSARGLTRALFSHIATDLGFFTGLAFLNAGALTATVEIVTLRPDGTELGSFVTVLRPGERVSKLIEELISGAAGQAGGFIWIKSDVPLFLTSIFGSLATGVLSNIPPQSVPVLFDPTPGDGEFRLDPPLAILEPAREQSFEVEGIAGPLAWSVNGIPGGNNIVGNVDGGGTYTAPALIPENLPVTVAASSQQQAVGASVDLLSPEDFRFDLGVLQSVAYLSGLQRLFTAELIVVPGPQESGGPAQGASSTRIVDVTGDTGQPLATLVGKEVAKMISFTADNGLEYLLMSATNTGQVLRVDPASGAALEIALGLDQPTTLALDPATGDLLVAESEEVTSIDSAALNAGLTAGAGSYTAAGASAKERLFKVSNGRLVVDECTSNVFVAQPDQDRIAEFVRLTGALRTVVENLENPRALLGFHRNQVSCPRSFHLLVGEKGAERISLVIPSTGQTRPWIDSAGVVDITFVPEGTPFAPGGAVILARDEGSGGGLSLIPFPRVYSERALNPPRKLLPGPCRVAQVTETEDAQNRVPVITGDGSQIFFVSDTDLVGTNGDGNHEIFRFALDTREFAQVTDTTGAESHHPAPDSDGSSLAFLSTANLTGSDPQGTNLYVLSGSGIVRAPGTPEPGESFQLDRAGGRLVYTSSDNVAGQNADGNPEIRVWDSSFGSVQLTETVGGANGLAGISGNGAWVVFVSTANIEGLNPGGDEVVFLHEMASLTTSLVGVVRSNGEGLSGIPPLVGFDASHILFSSFEDLTGENPKRDRALFVFDRVGQTMRQVADDLDLADLSDISAGESILAMSSNKNPVKLNKDNNREIFLIDLPGEQILQVTRSLEVTNQKATINRDASLLSFRSTADFNGQNRDGNFEIFVADCSDIQ